VALIALLLQAAALLPAAGASPCTDWGAPRTVARLDAPQVDESSGLVADPDGTTWYTHNDSGADPELYAFDLQGTLLSTHTIPEARAHDWEAMDAGPCPDRGGGRCLFLGDIGDNPLARSSVQVYAVPLPTGPGPLALVGTWELTYPEGPRNAEALLVHPDTGALTIVAKTTRDQAEVYRAPAQPGTHTLAEVGRVSIPSPSKNGRKITGGAWHRSGEQLLLRTYTRAWRWAVDPAAPDAHWSTPPTPVRLRLELQGEAIAYDVDGGVVTTSEGAPMPITVRPCTSP
jgi:hypothetical protein